MGAAALSITANRQEVVDFTLPWADVNLTMIVQSDVDAEALVDLLTSDMFFGVIGSSPARDLLEASQTEPFATIWQKIASRPNVTLLSSYSDGIERVRNDINFGFIAEDQFAEYTVNRICGLKTVGSFLPQAGYGFAVTKGGDLKEVVDDALLKMKDSGRLEELHDKYWETETCGASHAQWMSATMLCSLLATLVRLF